MGQSEQRKGYARTGMTSVNRRFPTLPFDKERRPPLCWPATGTPEEYSTLSNRPSAQPIAAIVGWGAGLPVCNRQARDQAASSLLRPTSWFGGKESQEIMQEIWAIESLTGELRQAVPSMPIYGNKTSSMALVLSRFWHRKARRCRHL